MTTTTTTTAHLAAHFRLPPPPHFRSKFLQPITSLNFPSTRTRNNLRTARKWPLLVKARLVEKEQQSESKSTEVDMKRMVEFLYEDLPHLFDDQGIDRTAYDELVKFRDPITKYDSIDGYLFNISLLKNLFKPDFQLQWVKQTGPYEITTRWTMVMTFVLLPWKPELVFTGTSVMEINPKSGKFCSHFVRWLTSHRCCMIFFSFEVCFMVIFIYFSVYDYWDSIENNEYFSVEGLMDVFKQLRYYKTPDLETPKYQILKRTASYEVRKYVPYIVVETVGNELSGSKGFNNIAGFIFGKNSKQEKIAMTTPVFTQTMDTDASKVAIQIVLPSDKDMSSLPVPMEDGITLRNVEGGIAAVVKFSGKATENIVSEKAQTLRSDVLKDQGARLLDIMILAEHGALQ